MFSVAQFHRDFPLKKILEILKGMSFKEFCKQLSNWYRKNLLVDNVFHLCLLQLNDFKLQEDQDFYNESCKSLEILFEENLHSFRLGFITQMLNTVSKLQLNWLAGDKLNQLLGEIVVSLKLKIIASFDLAIRNIMYALGRFSDQGLLKDANKNSVSGFLNFLFSLFEDPTSKLVLVNNIQAVSGILYGFNRLYANGLIPAQMVNIKLINELINDCAEYISYQIDLGVLRSEEAGKVMEIFSDFLFYSSWLTMVNHKVAFPESLYRKVLSNKALAFYNSYRMARVCASVVTASKSVPGLKYLREESLNFIKNPHTPSPLINFQDIYQSVFEKFKGLPALLKGKYTVTTQYRFIETAGLTVLKNGTPFIIFNFYRFSRLLNEKGGLTGKDEYIKMCVEACLEHLELDTRVECVFLNEGKLDVGKVSDDIIRTILKIVEQKESFNKITRSPEFYQANRVCSSVNTQQNLTNYWR